MKRASRRAGQLLVQGYRWLVAQELVVLLVPILVVAGIWTFIEIADEVTEGETQHYDERIVEALRSADDPARPIGPDWLHRAAIEITALGSSALLILATLAVLGFLALRRHWHQVVFVSIAIAGGAILGQVLKYTIGRERPFFAAGQVLDSPSFPSGHAMMSVILWLTLGALLARLEPYRWLRSYIYMVALVIVLLVGVTRVYLGVHYPTDVLAGWTAGLVWAMTVWLLARLLQQRGAIEA